MGDKRCNMYSRKPEGCLSLQGYSWRYASNKRTDIECYALTHLHTLTLIILGVGIGVSRRLGSLHHIYSCKKHLPLLSTFSTFSLQIGGARGLFEPRPPQGDNFRVIPGWTSRFYNKYHISPNSRSSIFKILEPRLHWTNLNQAFHWLRWTSSKVLYLRNYSFVISGKTNYINSEAVQSSQ